MAQTVEFPYRIGEAVCVVPLKVNGVVTGLTSDWCGITMRVVYWYDGKRAVEWLHEWDIEPAAAGRR